LRHRQYRPTKVCCEPSALADDADGTDHVFGSHASSRPGLTSQESATSMSASGGTPAAQKIFNGALGNLAEGQRRK
jgi:hypothetical protein